MAKKSVQAGRRQRSSVAAAALPPALLAEQQQRIEQQFAEADAARLKAEPDNQRALARLHRLHIEEALKHGRPDIAKTLRLMLALAVERVPRAVAALHEDDRRQKAAASGAHKKGHRSAMLDRITEVMRPHAAGGTSFKAFMSIWTGQTLDGLRLKVEGDRYSIDDENELDATRRGTWKTIRNWYSAAGKIHDKRRKS